MNTYNKFILIILDGWGKGKQDSTDAIASANPVNLKRMMEKYPHTQLLVCGENVGLPDGQMGNSEVGHLNIGAGRIVYQDLVRINKECESGNIGKNKVITDAYTYAKKNNKSLHLLGLVSDGGVHSSDKHLYKLCDIAKEMGLEKVYIHALTDGRDCDPYSGLGFINGLEEHLRESKGRIASVCGRYFTMDRDNRWERIKQGYDLLVNGTGKHSMSAAAAIEESYKNGITDEFIKPVAMVDEEDKPIATIREGDVVFCFNFRTDRLREITTVLTQKAFPEYGMKTIPLYYLTMTRYDDSFQNIYIAYEKDNVSMTLGETISKLGLKQVRIAETEKYPHVTFFFSGGREKVFPGEKRILIPSPKVPTYDLQPEMSAIAVKDAIVAEISRREFAFFCLNFANGDMVGHTGVYDSILKAVQVVDGCVEEVVSAALANGYEAMIIADHGNADHAVNDDGSPNTAHSLNPVPCILVSDRYKIINPGILADIAPTILSIMNIPVPDEMKGRILVTNQR